MSFASRARGLKALACAAAVVAGLAAAPAARSAAITNVYVFGDSLMDVGNVNLVTGGAQPPSFYFNGRWSNGPLAVDLFAAAFGVTLAPNLLGGTNYAWGGAQAQIVPGGVLDVPEQINLFAATLAGTPADPNAIYVVDGGGNDIATALASANPVAYLTSALNSFATSIGSLASLGAQHLLLFNVPDIGATPRVRELDAQLGAGGTLIAGATQLTNLFNHNLAGIVAGARSAYGIDIDVVDLYGIGKAIDANPAAYGITNPTDACVTAAGICATPNNYAYWDPFHPTARIGQIWAGAMLAAVPEPGMLALLGVALLAFALSRRRK
jgi:outer membrane lipase/esterase